MQFSLANDLLGSKTGKMGMRPIIKLHLKVGLTEKKRRKIYIKTRKKWEKNGWKVLEYIDGSMFGHSFMILEKI